MMILRKCLNVFHMPYILSCMSATNNAPNASPVPTFILQCVLQCDLCVALRLSCVIKFVTHSFPPQMQVPGMWFVCAGQTCLCSWLLWWGGTAQRRTHLSLLRWGDAGGHLQVHRYCVLFCVCACVLVQVCVWVLKWVKVIINCCGWGCRIPSVIIYYGSFLTIYKR